MKKIIELVILKRLEATISEKLKMQKSENLFYINFRSLRVILDQKMKTALFERVVCISLTRTEPISYDFTAHPS